jgi:hypothetical protein
MIDFDAVGQISYAGPGWVVVRRWAVGVSDDYYMVASVDEFLSQHQHRHLTERCLLRDVDSADQSV